jgi:hypothetical protein
MWRYRNGFISILIELHKYLFPTVHSTRYFFFFVHYSSALIPQWNIVITVITSSFHCMYYITILTSNLIKSTSFKLTLLSWRPLRRWYPDNCATSQVQSGPRKWRITLRERTALQVDRFTRVAASCDRRLNYRRRVWHTISFESLSLKAWRNSRFLTDIYLGELIMDGGKNVRKKSKRQLKQR